MQLFILFLKKVEVLDQLLKALGNNGIKGGTIVDALGMGESLANMEDFPYFRLLRQYIDSETHEHTKLLMMAIKDQDVVKTSSIVKEVVGDLGQPNTGVIITLPILYCEGIVE